MTILDAGGGAQPGGSTAALASWAATVVADAIAHDARHATARLLLDTIGCMLGGSASDVARRSQAWLTTNGLVSGSGPEATVVGTDRLAPPLAAAYANGRAAAVLDADETYPSDRQTSHLAAATVATALAVAESRDATRGDLLASIAVGYEVGARICDALVPSEGQAGRGLRAGWGPGSVLAATVAAGRAMGLEGRAMAHALGIAGTHVDPPPLQWPESIPAPMVKSADAGWHALTALSAAQMAAIGMTGYDRILDGEQGLWRALGYVGWDAVAATDGLGARWIVEEASFKRWPCQFWMQPALTALWHILEDETLEPDELESVELATNDKCLGPRFHAVDPAGEIDRAFSFPHAVAMLALRIPAGPGWSADALADDPAVRRLRALVRVVRHPEADRIADWVVDHQIRDLPARATVRARGRTLTAETRFGLGSPWSDATRLSDEALVRKYQEMTTGTEHADGIVPWVLSAPGDAPVRQLTARLRATRVGRPPMEVS